VIADTGVSKPETFRYRKHFDIGNISISETFRYRKNVDIGNISISETYRYLFLPSNDFVVIASVAGTDNRGIESRMDVPLQRL
jgi:hypothetical protein